MKICSIDSCKSQVLARGWCRKHYLRWRRNGNPERALTAGERSNISRQNAPTKHGLRKHPLYQTWFNMIQRCEVASCISYKNYGAKGVRVCDRWKSVASFIEDMGEKPDSSYTLDRIDPNKGYEPGNCRWASRKEQSRKRPHYVKLDMQQARQIRRLRGEGVAIKNIAQDFGVSIHTVKKIIYNEYWVES